MSRLLCRYILCRYILLKTCPVNSALIVLDDFQLQQMITISVLIVSGINIEIWKFRFPGYQIVTLTVLVFGPESVSYERSRRETAAKFNLISARVFFVKIPQSQYSMIYTILRLLEWLVFQYFQDPKLIKWLVFQYFQVQNWIKMICVPVFPGSKLINIVRVPIVS